jgi:hypothetical protein
MLPAMVGSPIWGCQEATGSWLVSNVERTSQISRNLRRSAWVCGAIGPIVKDQ